MTLHKEGTATILIAFITLVILGVILNLFLPGMCVVHSVFYFFAVIIMVLILWFFRYPHRVVVTGNRTVLCPADGKIVTIETVQENEYFHDKRIQVSIFMSPLNVHANWYPISGMVKYSKYHPGKYLVAFHPKSSTENERTTIVVEHANKQEILFRQIAGAMARRIVCYAKADSACAQGTQFGFIKFGSRIDVYLPLNAEIKVKLHQKVSGQLTCLAELSE